MIIDNRQRKFTDAELISYMREFLKNNDQLPTNAAMCEKFGVTPNAIQQKLNRLEATGLFTRNEVGKIMFSR